MTVLFFDRRPHNFGELKLGWARLPLGAQLSRLQLPPGYGIRGSGDDLRTFFYRLQNADGALDRNVFGREFDGCGYRFRG